MRCRKSLPTPPPPARLRTLCISPAWDWAILEDGKGHPRAAGTFTRVLGRYMRQQHALTLMDALRKMTLLPAKRLGIESKGRIGVGADADLAIFDAGRVTDRATYENPAQYSEGMVYMLVNGVPVVRNGLPVEGVAPGSGLRRWPRCDESVTPS
jgi:N-acyl-D-aspartate/D-glutamate deacylase